MAPDSETQIERRPSDFGPRPVVLMQAGTCCCCSCLHWVGAAVGLTVGVVTGYRICRSELSTDGAAARWLKGGMWSGIAFTFLTFTTIGLVMAAAPTRLLTTAAEMVTATLVFVPTIVVLPVCLTIFLWATLAMGLAKGRNDDERAEVQRSFSIAGRISLWIFVSTAVWSGVGFLVMLIITLLWA